MSMVGKALGHYQISGQFDKGGMGEVFRAKTLDVSSAKSLSGKALNSDSSRLPTLTGAMIGAGIVIKTVADRSPRQSKGKSVGARAGTRIFGCILCEGLAGQSVFAGKTVTETLEAVWEGEPEWEESPAKGQHLLHRGIAGKFIFHICIPLLIFMSLFAVLSTNFTFAADATGDESASEENQRPQNQETVQENFKISVDVNLVTADVTIIGNVTSQLHAQDFSIYDNGILQKADYFSHDLLPLAVAVLIDTSSSVETFFPMLKLAALVSLRHLRPEDQVALFSFNSSLTKLSDLTADRLQIAKQINTLESGGGTNIYGAISQTVSYLGKNAPDRRRAIILVSDNCNEPKWGENAKKVKNEMLESSATLYSIRTPGMDFSDCSEPNAQIQSIADETGGELLDVDGSTSLQEALKRAISNLRFQYTLGFIPSNPGEHGSFHKLTVKLAAKDRCPGCRLLARSGYYSGISAAPPPHNGVQQNPADSKGETDQLLVQRIMLTAGTTGLDLPDIPFTVDTAKQTDSNGQPQIRLDFQINPAQIGFSTVQDRHACNLSVTVFQADKKGKILDINGGRLAGQLSQESYNQILKDGISFSMGIPIKSSTRILRVVIFDEEGNKIGGKLVRLP